MNGYLTRLLRRSFDPSVAKVEPRLNTLFSPPEKVSSWPAQEAVGDSAESTPVNASPNDSETAPSGDSVTVAQRSVNAPLVTTAPTPLHSLLSPALALRSPGKVIHLENNSKDGTDSEGVPSHGTSEVREHVDSSSTEQREGESIVSSPAARTRQERKVTVRAAPPDNPHMRVAGLDQEGNESARIESQPLLTDQRSPASASPLSSRPSERVPVQAAQTDAGGNLLHGDKDATLTKNEKYKVVPARPLRASQRNEAARVRNSLLEYASPTQSSPSKSNFERSPLSPFPAQFHERGRRGPEASQPAEPIIEVTIGRVEVRGTVLPERQRASSKPGHGPNLEEYLRNRSGRSRE
jgi:hypothetical protein